ncbi:hypothetical protein QYF36_016821 [Acer negundo]|nr:hypothetical protein QYF36_016821 [Acer negundo]
MCSCTDGGEEPKMSAEKLRKLGWNCRPLEDTLIDSIEHYKAAGFLDDEKNVHLSKLEKASENLKLFRTDLLDYDSVLSTIVDCTGVFHVASPIPSTTVPNPEVKVCLNIIIHHEHFKLSNFDFNSNVDVRDVADAVLLAYEKPEAEGRYLCIAYAMGIRDLVDKMKSLYPNYNYPKSFTEGGELTAASSEKLQRLGWSYRSLEEILIDSVESYRKAGILN